MEGSKRITLEDHFLRGHGIEELYVYKCGNFFFQVATSFGETDVKIVGHDGHYCPVLHYTKNAPLIEWSASIDIEGDEWRNFTKEVQETHEVVSYFLKYIDKLKQGIIPDQEN